MALDLPTTTAANPGFMSALLGLSADLDLPSLLERFVAAATELTGARYGAINILDEAGASITFVQSGVPAAIVAALANPPHAVGVLGQIPAYGVLRLQDLTQHPAFAGLPPQHPPMGSFLGVAVRDRAAHRDPLRGDRGRQASRRAERVPRRVTPNHTPEVRPCPQSPSPTPP